MTTPLPAYRPLVIHPDWTLRANFSGPHPGHTKPKVHLFNGVTAACGRHPGSSAWVHSALIFHPPHTQPTCRSCQSRGEYPAYGVSPQVRADATAYLVTYALATWDPHVLTAAMRLLSLTPQVESIARLLANPTVEGAHE